MRMQIMQIDLEGDDVYEDSFMSTILVREPSRIFTIRLDRQLGFQDSMRRFLMDTAGGWTLHFDRPWFEVRIPDYALPDLQEIMDELEDNRSEWKEEYFEGEEYNIKSL
jgi:hypothetical protein